MIWYNSQKDLEEGGVEVEADDKLMEAIERTQNRSDWFC